MKDPWEEREATTALMEKIVIDALGPEKALEEICKMMPFDVKHEIYHYIIHDHNLEDPEADPQR